jgi:phytoene dehydrogenase-like protein
MSRRVVVIGAGINGLVAANYLQRGGCSVLLLEKKERVGGACTYATFEHNGREYRYPTGASVFGMMQEWVYRETGLANRLKLHRAKQPPLVYFKDDPTPVSVHTSHEAYANELKTCWGEAGDVVGFERDLDLVRDFLIDGFRNATSPSFAAARAKLGETLAARWIAGSAVDLFNHYFTADRTKIFSSMSVTESGPVPMEEPGTAFTIAVMAAGSVMNGQWGHVSGALWRLPLALDEINRELGVEVVTGAELTGLDAATRTVRFRANGNERSLQAQAIFFATDPVTAANVIGDPELSQVVKGRHYLGSSGKVVLYFREPVRWKDRPRTDDDASASRYLYAIDDFAEFQRANRTMRERKAAFIPSCFQVYCEGGAQRALGTNPDHDNLSIFFKDVGFGKKGAELPEVKQHVIDVIRSRVENPEALFYSALLTPLDLRETFFFPEGNIDHQEMRSGQTFESRGFSSDPQKQYYRLGAHEDVYYCGAGSYPCGSVAGTPGYMAAIQYLRS